MNFFSKKNDFESIFWLWVKKFLFWPKTSPGVSKLKCTCPNTILNKFPEKNHFHLSLRNLLRKFWIAQKLGFCHEGILRLQRIFWRDNFLEETNIRKLLNSEPESFGFLVKKNSRVAKTAFHVTRALFGVKRTFLRKTTSNTSDFQRKNSEILEKFQQWCQMRNLRVHKNFKKSLNEPGRPFTR